MNTYLAVALVSFAFTGAALADTKADTKATTKKDPMAKPSAGVAASKMTCQDFIALEDVQKPKAVYWAEGLNKKGKMDDAVFDVETTDRIIPVLVEQCRSSPTEPFVKKAKSAAVKK